MAYDVPDPHPRGTVVLIHGLYLNASCWEQWVPWLDERGFRAIARSWPGHEGDPAALRASPPPALRDLTLGDVVASCRALIADLDEPPYLVGHSMGGLVVQLLLAEGLGRGGVAIDSAPPKGLSSFRWSFLKTNLPLLGSLARPLLLTPAQFHYAFTHPVPTAEARAIYDRYVVPESRRIGRGPTTADGKVDFGARTAPLLFVSGAIDRVIPAGLNGRNARKYPDTVKTEHRIFPGRSHWIIGQQGWEEVANEAVLWLEEHAPRP